jgi:FtsH-binding integral membrane protein
LESRKTHRSSYVVNGCLAGAVLYFALHLSSSGRTAVDYILIVLICSAIAWNLFKLSRRLHRSEGTKEVWHVLRTVLFWIIGLGNTVFVKAGDVGSWRNWLGWVMLGLAVADTVALFLKERTIMKESLQADGGSVSPPTEVDTQE